jgi:ribosomal protein S12 methylthiotransferase accessory factor YcaO
MRVRGYWPLQEDQAIPVRSIGSMATMTLAIMAIIKVEAKIKGVQVVVLAADAFFVPVVRSLVPVHLERYSFQRTHSQILPNSKH